jgi:hypothetical protein
MPATMPIPDLDAILAAQQSWRVDARAGERVARPAAERACTTLSEALDVLAGNLASLGYPSFPGRVPASPGLARRVRKIERRLGGHLPPALKVFWQIVGGASFVDLKDYAHVLFWQGRGLGGPQVCCDGLYIDGCDDDWFDCMIDELDDRGTREGKDTPADPFKLPIAPDGFRKDNLGGGEPYAVVTSDDWLAPLCDFRWFGARRPGSAPANKCDLLSYLRTAILECAGFPGLFGRDEFEPIRQQLLVDVPVF